MSWPKRLQDVLNISCVSSRVISYKISHKSDFFDSKIFFRVCKKYDLSNKKKWASEGQSKTFPIRMTKRNFYENHIHYTLLNNQIQNIIQIN
jgi:hypothetical protein